MRESRRVREVDFIARLQELVDSSVIGLDADDKARILRAAAERVRQGEAGLECRAVPFVPGWRPIDEARHPGLGSSDPAALVLGDDAVGKPENVAYLLFDVSGCGDRRLDLDATLSFVSFDGSSEPAPMPNWNRRPVQATTFGVGADDHVVLRKADLRTTGEERLALAFRPERDLHPRNGWTWEQLDSALRDGGTARIPTRSAISLPNTRASNFV